MTRAAATIALLLLAGSALAAIPANDDAAGPAAARPVSPGDPPAPAALRDQAQEAAAKVRAERRADFLQAAAEMARPVDDGIPGWRKGVVRPAPAAAPKRLGRPPWWVYAGAVALFLLLIRTTLRSGWFAPRAKPPRPPADGPATVRLKPRRERWSAAAEAERAVGSPRSDPNSGTMSG